MANSNGSNSNKFTENIMQRLRQRWGLEEDDTSKDEELNLLTSNEAFYEVCMWEGVGSDTSIKVWIKDCYGIDLDEYSK